MRLSQADRIEVVPTMGSLGLFIYQGRGPPRNCILLIRGKGVLSRTNAKESYFTPKDPKLKLPLVFE